ncbi:AI-2E family transporter [Erysipelatoclostridium ramosum]|uniref:AI-2E family transporter n=1 Tax=Thomasclavelia ramosa TaxID=1547 RepID=UPI001D07D9A0|nr:AI-2E family transporter [Thomasclavelia ramosa]MCB7428642.1 AI-2E family transporter [Thomasclavelia ramosa]
MDGVKIDYKKILEIVLIGIGCYWALNNFQIILDIFNSILAVIMPFLLGIMIAFILNVLMIRIEKILSRFILDKKYTSFKRVISIIVSLLIVIGVIGIIITLIIPELTNAIKVIVKFFPETFEQLQVWINQNGNSFPQLETWINSVDLNSIASELSGLFKIGLTGMLGSTVDVISMFFTSILNLVVGIVFALYILMSKETLKRQSHKLIDAYIPKRISVKLLEVGTLARTTFSNFVIGQTVEAFILGTLCAVGMAVLNLPYAPMVGSLVGITAFVPIVGAFIGGGIGAFMILTVDPMQALIFIIFLVVLQQLEGDLIYPRVVGSSVGLPSIWVLFAVTVGGGLWGITGMLFSVPVLSVVYALIKGHVNKSVTKPKITNN